MFIITHKFSLVLKFHVSDESNKYMFGGTSGSKLLRKRNGMWIWIQWLFNKNRKKIPIKKLTFDLPWNYLKSLEHQLSWWKKLKTHIYALNPSVSWKIWKPRLALKKSLKNRYIVEWIYRGNLNHLPLRMLKVFLPIVYSFNWQDFSVRQQ